MENRDIVTLLKKYKEGSCTEKEKTMLESWYLQRDVRTVENLSSDDLLEDLLLIAEGLPLQQAIGAISIWPRIFAAAAILLFVTVGGYFFLNKDKTVQSIAHTNDISPGNNSATLTLASGQKIIIKKGLKGNIAHLGSTLIQIKDSSAITYTVSAKSQENLKVEYNTLSTIRGEQSPYALILADGTRVWLNAASSITFPTMFNGKNRKVIVAGEAYFEVAHNAKMPFRVEVGRQTIEDIGTSFDINSYNDEPGIKTTLIEGSIKLMKGKTESMLQPGQQATTQLNNDKIKIEYVNTELATAWKNGFFRFDNEELPTIMRQFSRWYDIQVVYDGPMRGNLFTGKITRNSNLSKVLEILALGGIHYRIEGKKLIIHP